MQLTLAAAAAALRRLWAKAPPARLPGLGRRADPALRGYTARWAYPVEAELRLYDEMRRTFPVLDIAVTRLVQLCGHPTLEGPAVVVGELEGWLRRVPIGPGQRGLGGWVEAQLDHLLVFGMAVGRVRLGPGRRDVGALLTLDPREVRLEADGDGLGLRVLHRRPGGGGLEAVPPAYSLLSLRAPHCGARGASLLRSLPFTAEACSIIENATAQVWQRMGAPSFHVNWQPAERFADPLGTTARGVIGELQETFTGIMGARREGEVRDFFTSGAVSVGVLGDAAQVLAVQESFRVFMEQMVAATGLPPWLLGLHWSSTERLSVQQADLLVAHVEALRRELQPQIERVVDLRQRLAGRPGRVRVRWPAVNLRDAAEQARAAAWTEQARQRRIENARRMWELGFWSQERAARDADPTLAALARPLPEPPGPARVPEVLRPND